MSIPGPNEGLAIVPNRGGQNSMSLSEADARWLGGGASITFSNSIVSFDLTTLTANMNVTVGQTGAGGDGTWSVLDVYPANCLVYLSAELGMDADGVGPTANASLFNDGTYNIGGIEWFSSTTTEYLSLLCAGFARMESGLITLNYGFFGQAVASEIADLSTEFCLSV